MVELKPFRFWCQKVLPLVYDDSLSYYELLCKVVKYLNDVIAQTNTISKAVEDLAEYVQHYFDSTDFEQMVNDKLDEMAESGELAELIASLGDLVKFYDTGDTVNANVGDVIFYNGESYVVEDSNKGYGIEVASGQWVNPNPYEPVQLGCVGIKGAAISDLTGGDTYTVLQGGCYDSTNGRYAFWFDVSGQTVTGMLVFADTNLNVISRHTYNFKHCNDITWCNDKNSYVLVSSDYIYLVNTSGEITSSIQNSSHYVGAISWDNDRKVFIGYTGGYVKFFDDDLNFICEYQLSQSDVSKLYPTGSTYSATQGCCIADGQFYLGSSAFYNDGYHKSGFRISHINTIDANIGEYYDGFYYTRGCELECITYDGSNMIAWGYSGARDYLEGSIIGFGDNAGDAPVNEMGYDIYVAEGSVNGDGLTPATPVNNIWSAVVLASRFPVATLHLLSDITFAGEVPVTNGFLTIDGQNHELDCEIIVRDATVYIYDTEFNQGSHDECVYATRSRLILSGCTFNANNAKNYTVRCTSSTVSCENITVNDNVTFLSAAGNTFAGVSVITGDGGQVASASTGSVVCINTREGIVVGFTKYGYQYGGLIIEGIVGDVNIPTSD